MPQVTQRQPRLVPRRRLVGGEVLLGVAVIGVFLSLCVQAIPAWALKARLTAVFTALPSARNDSLEQYAITGEFPPFVSARDAAPIERQTAPLTSFDIKSIGGGLLAEGHVGKDAQPFALSYLPAVSEEGEAHLRWLCGMHRAPAGWRATSAPAVLKLPPGVRYAECLDDSSEGA
jgi:hypothetical protein